MDISISICPTELEVGSEGHMYDEAKLLPAIRKFIEARFGNAANITCLQVGFRQGDKWSRIDGDAFAGDELLSEFFGLYGTDAELFLPADDAEGGAR